MRIFGAELSQIEREFIFRRENAGFVRYTTIKIDRNRIKVIALDPSLVMKSEKREYFVPLDGVPLPPERKPVQLNVVNEREVLIEDFAKGKETEWLLAKAKLKFFDSWEEIDLRKILRKEPHVYAPQVEREKDLFTKEDLIHTLQAPFKGDPTTIKLLTMGMAIFIHSSPPWMDEQGGIWEGAIGKRKGLSALSFTFDLIPREFKRATSKYYYKLTMKGNELPPPSAVEANLCYVNPSIGVHLPLPVDQQWVRIEWKKDYISQFEDALPLVRARIVDSIHIVPEPESEKYLEDATEKVVELARDTGMPMRIDFSGVAPMLSSGLARLNRSFEIDKRTVSSAVELYELLYKDGLKLMNRPLSPKQLMKLEGNERTVYITLHDLGAEDREVSLNELKQELKLSDGAILAAIEKLKERGIMYEPRRELYRLIPLT